MYIYIYIERERKWAKERRWENEKENTICIYMNTHIYIYNIYIYIRCFSSPDYYILGAYEIQCKYIFLIKPLPCPFGPQTYLQYQRQSTTNRTWNVAIAGHFPWFLPVMGFGMSHCRLQSAINNILFVVVLEMLIMHTESKSIFPFCPNDIDLIHYRIYFSTESWHHTFFDNNGYISKRIFLSCLVISGT